MDNSISDKVAVAFDSMPYKVMVYWPGQNPIEDSKWVTLERAKKRMQEKDLTFRNLEMKFDKITIEKMQILATIHD